MSKTRYTGHENMTYLHYLDLSTGRTLAAEPGETYDVASAGGNLLSAGTDMPQDGRWVPVKDEKSSKKGHVTGEDTMPSGIRE